MDKRPAYKTAQKRIDKSEERYRSVFENTSTSTVIIEEDMTISMANAEFEKLSGYSKEEIEGRMKWTEFIAKEDLEWMKTYHIKRRRKGKGAPGEYEFRFIDRQGNIRYIFNKVTLIPGTVRIVASLLDITERRAAEKRLRQSEKRYRDLFNSINDLVYTQDLEGRFISFNRALCKTFGYDQEELVGRRAADFMMPKYRPLFKSEYLEQVKARGYCEGVSSYFAKDGRKIFIEYHSSLVKPEEGEPYISGTGRDVTERVFAEKKIKQLQEQMLQSKKMEALGTLALALAPCPPLQLPADRC